MRLLLPLRSTAAVLVIGAALALASPAPDNNPPRELVQYVHDARKQGVKDDKIKQQALAAGWTNSLIDAALTYEGAGRQPAASTSQTAASALKTQPDGIELQPGAPAKTPSDGLTDKPASSPAAATSTTPAPAGDPGVAKPQAQPAADEYQIDTGDTLQVTIWNHTEVSVPNEIVRPDGKITVPLIKEVGVAGLTPREVEKQITERLSKYIEDPNVTIVVTAMRPKNIYVTGAVKKEGPVVYVPGMTVLQALSEAGGLNDYAKRKKIYVLHTENGREYQSDFNYDEVLRGQHMEQNIVLVPNDTIVVPH